MMKFVQAFGLLTLVLKNAVEGTTWPDMNHIDTFINIGFCSNSEHSEAINCQNGEFGADFDVVSYPNCDGRKVSPTGSSYLDISGTCDQRWKFTGGCPSGSNWEQTFWPKEATKACVEYTYHPAEGTQCCSPRDGVDWSGNMAITSSNGRVSISNTDVYADLVDYGYNDIGIIAPGNEMVQSNSNAHYFPMGHGPGSDSADNCNYGQCDEPGITKTGYKGTLGTNSEGTDGVGLKRQTNVDGLKTELNTWFDFVADMDYEHTWNKQLIENRNWKDSNSGPYIIELLMQGESSPPGSNVDVSFQDTNGDGAVVIDVQVGSSGWQWTNTDVIIVGDPSVTAIFRVRSGANFELSNVSIQRCTAGGDPKAVLFALAVDEGNTNDEVLNAQNAIFNNVVFWEIADTSSNSHGINENGKNVITCQNCQGCSQFLGDYIQHSDNRFNKCTFGISEGSEDPVVENRFFEEPIVEDPVIKETNPACPEGMTGAGVEYPVTYDGYPVTVWADSALAPLGLPTGGDLLNIIPNESGCSVDFQVAQYMKGGDGAIVGGTGSISHINLVYDDCSAGCSGGETCIKGDTGGDDGESIAYGDLLALGAQDTFTACCVAGSAKIKVQYKDGQIQDTGACNGNPGGCSGNFGTQDAMYMFEVDCNNAPEVAVEAPAPELTLVKEASKDSCNDDKSEQAEGNSDTTFNYCYTVKNTGNVGVCHLHLTETGGAGPSVGMPDGCLEAGQETTVVGPGFTCGTAVGLECTDGSNESTVATVTGTDSNGTPVSAQDTAGVLLVIPPAPAIELVKEASSHSCGINTKSEMATGAPGSAFNYCYAYKNTGNVKLCNIQLTDAGGAGRDIDMPGGCLEPGDLVALVVGPLFTCNEALGLSDGCNDGSTETTEATVTGTDPDGTVVTALASAGVSIEVPPAPAITLVKDASTDSCGAKSDMATGFPDSTFNYCYTFKNTGNVKLCNVQLGDLGGVAGEVAPLPMSDGCLEVDEEVSVIGVSFSCNTDGVALSNGCEAGSTEDTVATITATDPSGTPVSATDNAGVLIDELAVVADPMICPTDMGMLGSKYGASCNHKGVHLVNSRPDALEDPLLLSELEQIEDMFINIVPGSGDGSKVSFRAINPFAAHSLTMYVRYEEALVVDDTMYSTGIPRRNTCEGAPNLGQCGLVGEDAFEAVCVGAGGDQPYAMVNVYFVDTSNTLTFSGTSKVHECCEPDDTDLSAANGEEGIVQKVFSYTFAISCNCPGPASSRHLRGVQID